MTKTPIALHITDTHLSENTIEVNFSVFAQAIEKCLSLGLDKIFHGGDIFTSRKGQSEIVLNAFKFILDQCQTAGIQLIAIGGNHDKQSYVSETSVLDAFTGHPALIVFSPYGAIQYEDIIFHFLPYFDEDLSYPEYIKLIECPVDKKNILITHIAVDGVQNNSGSKVENELDVDVFSKFDLVLVGHYHNRQILGHIVYTGSTHQANFGEDDRKGCTIIYDDCSYSFESFVTPSYKTIEIKAEEIDSKLLKLVKSADNTGNIRLKISGEYTEKQKPLIVELQNLGIKVEKIKEDYLPSDTLQSETVQITSNDIIETYHEWTKDRKIEDAEYGLNLLKKVI